MGKIHQGQETEHSQAIAKQPRRILSDDIQLGTSCTPRQNELLVKEQLSSRQAFNSKMENPDCL